MSPLAALILFLFVLVFYILPALGVALLFKKAGEASWKAFIPLYNSVVMLQICERPWYWVLLQLIPFFGLFYTVVIWVEFVKTYNKTRFYQYALIPLTFGLYFLYVGLNPKTRFTGPTEMKKYSRSDSWQCIGVGVVIIAFIAGLRSFVFENYSLPTASMDKTLMQGDCLFVNRLSYGPRLPITPVSLPYLPGLFPLSFKEAYSKSVQLAYHRPFSSPVRRGDVIVFNFPLGDTVISLPEYQSMRPYYDVIRELGRGNSDSGRQIVRDNPDQYPLTIKPIDKEENYIKRCVALAGDTLMIRNEQVFIDGKAQPFPPESETYFLVHTKGQPLDETIMKETYGIDLNNPDEFRSLGSPNQYNALLNWTTRELLLKDGVADSITPDVDSTVGEVFPYDTLHAWTRDNYGPVWIPQKGATLTLTPENYHLYERVIRTYEGNKLEIKEGRIFLNGQEAHSYQFKLDYYWLMGDNLHGSQDSRYWGFVPENHIVGKAAFIWWSYDHSFRWNRFFKKVE